MSQPNQDDSSPIPRIAGLPDFNRVLIESFAFVENMFALRGAMGNLAFPAADEAGRNSGRENPALDPKTRQLRAELIEQLGCQVRFSVQIEQAQVFWRLRRQNRKLIVFSRNLSPVANLVVKLCSLGETNIFPSVVVEFMRESDFPGLVAAVGRLAGTPVRVCDASEPGLFLSVLEEACDYFDYAMCDWKLSASEKAQANRVTLDSKMKFLCPGDELERSLSTP